MKSERDMKFRIFELSPLVSYSWDKCNIRDTCIIRHSVKMVNGDKRGISLGPHKQPGNCFSRAKRMDVSSVSYKSNGTASSPRDQ